MAPGRWREWFGRREEPKVVFECRRCGTSVDGEVMICPECGTESIVKYEIS